MYTSNSNAAPKYITGNSKKPHDWNADTAVMRRKSRPSSRANENGESVRRERKQASDERAHMNQEYTRGEQQYTRAYETKEKAQRRNQLTLDVLKYTLLVVFVFASFTIIGKLSSIKGQNDDLQKLRKTCQDLVNDAESYRIQVDTFKSRSNIEMCAQKMGMIYPEDGDMQIVRLERWQSDSVNQTADGGARE